MANFTKQTKEDDLLHSESINQLENEVLASDDTISLDVPNVGQIGSVWCGPACTEAILRYFGINLDVVSRTQGRIFEPVYGFQHYLAELMGTNRVASHLAPLAGTNPASLIEVFNSFINGYGLNNRRFYGLVELPPHYANAEEFYRYIDHSLQNNMPVIFGFTGSLPAWRDCTIQVSHFIIIRGRTAVRNGNYNDVAYYYMDPGHGTTGTFTGTDLYYFLTNSPRPNALIRYNEEIMDWNDTINNRFEDALNEVTSAMARCSLSSSFAPSQNAAEASPAVRKVTCTTDREFYFNKDRSTEVIETTYSGARGKESWAIIEWNLRKKDPFNFSKIELIYDNIDDIYTKISLGNDASYGTKLSDFLKDKSLKDLLQNGKITDSNARSYANNRLMYWDPNNLVSYQLVGFSFYWENNCYYLQMVVWQYAKNYRVFGQGGGLWMGIGRGLKLVE